MGVPIVGLERQRAASMWRERQNAALPNMANAITPPARHQIEWAEGLDAMAARAAMSSSCSGCGAHGRGKCEYCGRGR